MIWFGYYLCCRRIRNGDGGGKMDEIKRDYVFYRDLIKKYLMIMYGEGSYLIDE